MSKKIVKRKIPRAQWAAGGIAPKRRVSRKAVEEYLRAIAKRDGVPPRV